MTDVIGLLVALGLGVVVIAALGAWWLAVPAALFLGLDLGERLLQHSGGRLCRPARVPTSMRARRRAA